MFNAPKLNVEWICVSLAKSRPAPLSGVHPLMQLPRAALSLALGYMPSPPSGGGKTALKLEGMKPS